MNRNKGNNCWGQNFGTFLLRSNFKNKDSENTRFNLNDVWSGVKLEMWSSQQNVTREESNYRDMEQKIIANWSVLLWYDLAYIIFYLHDRLINHTSLYNNQRMAEHSPHRHIWTLKLQCAGSKVNSLI